MKAQGIGEWRPQELSIIFLKKDLRLILSVINKDDIFFLILIHILNQEIKGEISER